MGSLKFVAFGILVLAIGDLNAKSTNKQQEEIPEPEPIVLGPAKSFVCPSNGNFPHEEKCELMYRCTNGQLQAAVLDCNNPSGADRLFDVQEGMCNHAFMVHCGNRTRPEGVPTPIVPEPTTTTQASTTPTTPPTTTKTTTTTPPTTTTTIPPTTTSRPGDQYNCTANGAYPHPRYCEKYFDCWNGTATLLSCHNGTLFDVEYFGCKAALETECGDRIRPSPVHFDCPDNEDKYYADPTDCAGFFRCVDGLSSHYMCPNDLVFNPELDVCDYPENVACGSEASSSPW